MNASTIKPGDRVRINAPGWRAHGRLVTVVDIVERGECATVTVEHPILRQSAYWLEQLTPVPRMSLPARMLLAAWHASGEEQPGRRTPLGTLAKLTDNVCGLHRIRRYGVTADDGLTADLTLTTEVQL